MALKTMMILAGGALVLALAQPANAAKHLVKVPLPTGPQLKYQQQEIVALTHFNMATFYKACVRCIVGCLYEYSRSFASFSDFRHTSGKIL